LSLSCAACHATLATEARFCPSCGTPAPAAAQATAPDPVRDILKVALGRQYEIQRLLGKGGMGAVYLATEAALEREVAIKVLPPDRGATKDSRDRFRREARTAARLSHPNIVPLHTFGDVDGTLYFVMGYVKGESLAALLKREGRLPIEDARRILVELCEALDYAHKLGVIHRDIKPDNVLIEEGTGRALLTDFGVAKALGAGQTLTEVGSVLGTPQYMSPEQAQGKADIDHRSDLYSLGVMAYAMLAGRLPFEGATPGDVMVQHITREAPPVSSLAPGIPSEITVALSRCLAKEPGRRFADGRSLKEALRPEDPNTPSEEFEDLPKMFRVSVGCGVALLYLGAWWLGGGDVSDPFSILPIMVGGVGAAFLVVVAFRSWQLRKQHFDGSRIVGEILRQPEGWMGWYPRRWRMKGDVWERLPVPLRRARVALHGLLLAIVFVALPSLIFSTAFTSHIRRTGKSPYQTDFRQWPLLPLVLPLAGAALFFGMRFQAEARRRGLDDKHAARTLDTPSWRRTFWLRPEIAVILLPEPSSAKAPTGASTIPAAIADDVASCARRLPESMKALGGRAEAAGHVLANAIALLDRQILALNQAFDPTDAARLSARLAALESGEAGGSNPEVQDILRKQIEAIRGLEARIQAASSQRALRLQNLEALRRSILDLQSESWDQAKATAAGGRMQELLARIEEPDVSRAVLTESPTIERNTLPDQDSV
jgi:predicted Ser/Thr protein kinase